MITIRRNACLDYTLSSDTSGPVTVTDLDGAVIKTGDFGNGDVSVVLEEEGVYIIEDSTGQYTLIELCKLIDCLMALLQALFCKDDNSLCPQGCSDAEVENLRQQLNKLVAAYGLYLLAVFHERADYFGVVTIDACRMEKLVQIEKFITDLQKITDKCGAGCGDTAEETPCSQC